MEATNRGRYIIYHETEFWESTEWLIGSYYLIDGCKKLPLIYSTKYLLTRTVRICGRLRFGGVFWVIN